MGDVCREGAAADACEETGDDGADEVDEGVDLFAFRH